MSLPERGGVPGPVGHHESERVLTLGMYWCDALASKVPKYGDVEPLCNALLFINSTSNRLLGSRPSLVGWRPSLLETKERQRKKGLIVYPSIKLGERVFSGRATYFAPTTRSSTETGLLGATSRARVSRSLSANFASAAACSCASHRAKARLSAV